MSLKDEVYSLIKDGTTDYDKIIKKVVSKTESQRDSVVKAIKKIATVNPDGYCKLRRGAKTTKRTRNTKEIIPIEVENTSQDIKTLKIHEMIEQERLDNSIILRNALKKFSKDDCAYDESLRRDLSIPQEVWRELRNKDEFRKNQVMKRSTRQRIWCHAAKKPDFLELDGIADV